MWLSIISVVLLLCVVSAQNNLFSLSALDGHGEIVSMDRYKEAKAILIGEH